MRRSYPGLVIVALLAGCAKAPPPGNPEFNDAIHQTFVGFRGEEVDLAFALRALEANIDANLDIEANSAQDRALSPDRLTALDVVDLTHPEGRDPADALPVAVAGLSAFTPDDATNIQMLTDQTVVEPYSPNFFERSFLAGDDCWQARECPQLETFNDLIKENLLMTVPYEFLKDFRWVDMNLPDPADVPEGEEPVNDGDPRWAFVAKSWQEESFSGEGGNTTLAQSYTIEVWIPRDAGTLRMLGVWSETEFDDFNFSDDQVAGTTRQGVDDNFKAQERWMEENLLEE